MTRERTRRLEWEGSLNARDLGGYRAADGQETRWGAIVRSDSLHALTETGQAALVAYGVRSIVDLRLPQELEVDPNPFAEPGQHGIAYTNVSFIDPGASPPDTISTIVEDYTGLLQRFATRVGTALTAIARAPEGGVLVHCAAGKDRTGLVCALVLDLAGVDRETIGADYALSGEYLKPRQEEWLLNGPGERADREKILVWGEPRAEVMAEVLDRVEDRYGGSEAYLREAGVDDEAITRLRSRLLAPE